jgi:hypothetical protein
MTSVQEDKLRFLASFIMKNLQNSFTADAVMSTTFSKTSIHPKYCH